MTIEQMRKACADGVGQVTFTIPRKPSGLGYGIRLTPRSGPVGQVVCVNSRGDTVARFDCKAVLRWLDRQGT